MFKMIKNQFEKKNRLSNLELVELQRDVGREQHREDQRFRHLPHLERHQRRNEFHRNLRLDGARGHPQRALLRESRCLVRPSVCLTPFNSETVADMGQF